MEPKNPEIITITDPTPTEHDYGLTNQTVSSVNVEFNESSGSSSTVEEPICQSYSDSYESESNNNFTNWFSQNFLKSNESDNVDAVQRKQWPLNYREAAIYLEEGYNNDKFDYHPQAYSKLPVYLVVHSHLYYLTDLFACLLILSLAIFEKPAVDGYHLSESTHASMELFGLAVISLLFWIKFHWMGTHYFVRHKRTMIKSIVLILMVTEAIVVLLRQDSHFRVTRSLRPVFLIDNYYFGGVRRVIRQTIQSLRTFMEMLLLLLFFLVFFSISGFYLFSSVPEYEQFTTIWNSFISLYVLLTTSNFPDVMMPAYKHNQLYVLFFVFFLCVNLYFLLNIMVAVVYNSYSQIEKEKFRKLYLHRRRACKHAFRLLVTKQHDNHIQFIHFAGLLQHLKPNSTHLERYLMFKSLILNDRLSGTSPTHNPNNELDYQQPKLTLNKFYNIYEILNIKWENQTIIDPWFQKWIKCVFLKNIFERFHLFVTNKKYDYVTYGIILLATAYQLLDAIIGYERWQERVGLPTSASTICLIFIILYSIEISMKLFILGPKLFFQTRWNCFDCFITVFAFTTYLLSQYQITESLSTSFFSFRALRLIDLLRNNVDRYQDILGPFSFIIAKRFASVTLVVLIVYYFFAIIAMECFGSYQLSDCCKNTSIEAYYSTSSSTQLFYYLNNFNDLFSSFITLFELMVVNNWPIIMKSYVIVTGTQLTSIFFMIFYMISLLVITIVIAFVIDTIQFQIQFKSRFGQETSTAKILVDVDLYLDEIENYQLLKVISVQSSLIHYLFSSSFLLCSYCSSHNRLEDIYNSIMISSRPLSSSSNSNMNINANCDDLEDVYPSPPGVLTFRGTRFRDKFSYNLRMYSDEIESWNDD